MFDITITNQQKQYLLYFLESQSAVTLTKVADYFRCSKVNSKKIIDRMVCIGLVYKDNNKMYLTDLGQRIAEENQSERADMALVLNEGLGIEKDAAYRLASNLLTEESQGMRNKLLSMANYFGKLADRRSDSITSDEMIKILGVGEFKTYFVIFREAVMDPRDAFMPLSMALEGFYKDARIVINNEGNAHMEIRTKTVVREIQGQSYSSEAKLLAFYVDGEKMEYPIDKICHLPFSLIKEWYYIGGGILQASLDLCVMPENNIRHQQFAQFVFTINLFNLV